MIRLYFAHHNFWKNHLRPNIIISTLSLFLIIGCSSNFERYVPTSAQESASNSYKNVRLLDDHNRTETVLSTVYLNKVYPSYADGYAHFIVAFYNPQNENRLFFDDNMTDEKGYVLLLGKRGALAAEKLDNDDLLLELMPVSNSWSSYYYVRYPMPSARPVLVLENDHTVKAVITY